MLVMESELCWLGSPSARASSKPRLGRLEQQDYRQQLNRERWLVVSDPALLNHGASSVVLYCLSHLCTCALSRFQHSIIIVESAGGIICR